MSTLCACRAFPGCIGGSRHPVGLEHSVTPHPWWLMEGTEVWSSRNPPGAPGNSSPGS